MWGMSEQGRGGLLWTIFDGPQGDTRQRIASFTSEDDARGYMELRARAEAAEKLLGEAVEIINGFLGYGSDPNYPWERARTFVESIATFPPSAGESGEGNEQDRG